MDNSVALKLPKESNRTRHITILSLLSSIKRCIYPLIKDSGENYARFTEHTDSFKIVYLYHLIIK